MRKLAFILFLVLGLIFHLAAQSDYVIDYKGDTTWGVLKKSLLGKVRLETADGKLFPDPELISLYHYAGEKVTYVSRILPGYTRPVFILLLAGGAINMYSYTVGYNSGRTTYSTTTWYAEKKNHEEHEVHYVARRNIFVILRDHSGLRGSK